jgi:hypothetical protein
MFNLIESLDIPLIILVISFSISKRVTLFGDNLNIINVSGIVVVFLGVFLYKVTHYLSAQKESSATDENDKSYFSRISQADGSDIFVYEDELPRRTKRQLSRGKLSDPDLTLSFRIDDEDDEEDDDSEHETGVKSMDGSSPLREPPLRGRINGSSHGPSLEIDKKESRVEVV